MSVIDATLIKDGQKVVATLEQAGEIIESNGVLDVNCIVQTDNGPQKAIKTYSIGGGGAVSEDIPWQKPDDWFDMRNGAVGNSVYFLVGHSADYSTYPTFTIWVQTTNNGTYDVFVDGIKQATTANATDTVLTWQTLALSSGFDVTYPSALRTHIVRVTPTSSSNTIYAIRGKGAVNQGVLWAHFTLTNKVSLSSFGGLPNSGCTMNLLEAITAVGDKIKTSTIENAFKFSTPNLAYVPAFDGDNGSITFNNSFRGTKIKKLVIKNGKISPGAYFGDCADFEKFDMESPYPLCIEGLKMLPKLKEMPPIYCYNNTTGDIYTSALTSILQGDVSLNPFMLDLTSFTNTKRLTIGGTSSARIDGLKRLLVSSSAPFDGTSPQIDVSYTGLDRQALVDLFNSMPTVTNSQVIDITGTTGAADLDATDLAIATGKGWTVTK